MGGGSDFVRSWEGVATASPHKKTWNVQNLGDWVPRFPRGGNVSFAGEFAHSGGIVVLANGAVRTADDRIDDDEELTAALAPYFGEEFGASELNVNTQDITERFGDILKTVTGGKGFVAKELEFSTKIFSGESTEKHLE